MWTSSAARNHVPFRSKQHPARRCSSSPSIFLHCRTLADSLTKKNKKDKIEVKPFMVKNYLWVFVNSQIINPAFDSQVSTCCWDPQVGQQALLLVGV